MSMTGGRPSKKKPNEAAKAKTEKSEASLIETFVKKSPQENLQPPAAPKPRRKRGRPKKRREPQFRTTIDMPESLHDRLEEIAFYERRSLREIMIEAIQEWIVDYDEDSKARPV